MNTKTQTSHPSNYATALTRRLRTIALTVSVALFAALTVRCSQSPPTQPTPPQTETKNETEKRLTYGDDLKTAIDQFETSRTSTLQACNVAVQTVQDKLKPEKLDLTGAAKTWRVKWTDARGKVQHLEQSLSDVGQRSQAYFQQLDEIAGAINRSQIQKSEIQKNKKIMDQWAIRFKEASEIIGRLKLLLKEGDDFQAILELAALRGQLEKELNKLSEITQQANDILPLLKALTEEGRRLTSKS